MSNWYHVWPMTDEPSIEDSQWYEQFRRAHGYSCGHDDFDYNPDPIVIGQLGEDVALNFPARVAGCYARSDLLDVLSPEAEEYLSFGSIVHRAKGPLDDLKTLWSPSRVTIRGGRRSYCWICDVCGQLVYNPMGRWYVLSSELGDLPLYLDRSAAIIVNENLYQRLKRRRWKKVDIRKLTVLDKPRDGFPVDLRATPPELQRRCSQNWETR